MFRFVRTSLLESQYYPPPNDFMERLLEQNELKQLEKEQTMQVRFLELLEGLPEEVQSALLENAYRDTCVAKKPMLDLRLVKCPDNGWWIIGLCNENSERDGYEPISKSRLSKLEAWRDAYERLSK